MSEPSLCSRCGAPMHSFACPEGLCPRCLMDVAMGGPSELDLSQPDTLELQADTVDAAEPAGDRVLDAVVGQVLDEKYRMEQMLGQGGMGAVYLATHLGTGRLVAVKVIAPRLMAQVEFVERFKREAKATGRLRHPNVVNVTDFGFADIGSRPTAYLVMEYLDGRTLGTLLKERASLPLGFVIDVVEQVASAVDAAHRLGIVHRDLKPDNIWLEPDGRGGFNVKVLDFGLAKLLARLSATGGDLAAAGGLCGTTQEGEPALSPDGAATSFPAPVRPQFASGATVQSPAVRPTPDEADTVLLGRVPTTGHIDPRTVPARLTRVGTVLGTPMYMSPEQCRGEQIDGRSDIYSLGVITYQMIVGKPPFAGEEMHELLLKQIETPPPPLRARRRKLPRGVEQTVLSALAKSPSGRPPDARSFASALRLYAEGDTPLMQDAFGLFWQNRVAFQQAALFVYLPALLVTASLMGLASTLPLTMGLSSGPLIFNQTYTLVIAFLVIAFAGSVYRLVCARMVEEVRLRPGRKVSVTSHVARAALQTPNLLSSSFYSSARALRNAFPDPRSGLRSIAASSLRPPVLALENVPEARAVQRAHDLASRVGALPSALLMRELASAFGILVAFLTGWLLLSSLVQSNDTMVLAGTLFLASIGASLVAGLIDSAGAVALSLLYFRARAIGSEREEETPDRSYDFESFSELAPSRRRLVGIVLAVAGAFVLWLPLQWLSLFVAVLVDSVPAVRALCASGLDIQRPIPIFAGSTPLGLAVQIGKPRMAHYLLERGADANAGASDPYFPAIVLAVGARYSDREMVDVLIKGGADVDARTFDGESALMLSSRRGELALVTALVDYGADVDAQDVKGETALIHAARAGQRDVVRLLLERGADESVRNGQGRTAVEVIREGSLEKAVSERDRAEILGLLE